MGLGSAIEDRRIAARSCALLAIVGVVNIPIIHYSVEWWNTLHQGASVTKLDAPSIETSMLIPLLVMALAFKLFYAALVLIRARADLLFQERKTNWVRDIIQKN
jgi:heme exporter protein C